MTSIEKIISIFDKHNHYYELNEDDSFFIDIDDEFGEGITYESLDQRLHIVGYTGDPSSYHKKLYNDLNNTEKKQFIKYLEDKFNVVIDNVSTYYD